MKTSSRFETSKNCAHWSSKKSQAEKHSKLSGNKHSQQNNKKLELPCQTTLQEQISIPVVLPSLQSWPTTTSHGQPPPILFTQPTPTFAPSNASLNFDASSCVSQFQRQMHKFRFSIRPVIGQPHPTPFKRLPDIAVRNIVHDVEFVDRPHSFLVTQTKPHLPTCV